MSEVSKKLFWLKVDVRGANDCWLWTASVDTSGYGWGISVNRSRRITAHRYSWMLKNGPIPRGMIICHKCNTPRCVNPKHLYAGTHKDNMRDLLSSGNHFFAKQTHCKYGHEFTPENLEPNARNIRQCRECRRRRCREQRARKRSM